MFEYLDEFSQKFDEESLKRLKKIKSRGVHNFIENFLKILNPKKIFVSIGTDEDREYIKRRAIEEKEEEPLKIPNHTIHFDGYYDQGRDKKNTKFMVSPDTDLDPTLNLILREEGEKELNELMKDICKDREIYILFKTLGPKNSIFTIPCIQITDSPYVAHSENLLYRDGYEDFLKLKDEDEFFRFVHSEGELDDNKTSKNIDKRRIYIDVDKKIVYSLNTQYGGNSIGLKKLALRLAIKKAYLEGWLCEHMLIVGINGPNGRVTYLTGAFPSLCGKTSTATLMGERLVGDDIALIKSVNGEVRAANFEKGMFGIIMGINSKDDPYIWEVLNSPYEVIFSNVLKLPDGSVYWIGKDGEIPERGYNHSGEWYKGKKDKEGKEIDPSHKNARFTFELKNLKNCDANLENPEGVVVKGFIYGGRDSDTWVPICEAFNYQHGIILKGASLESETTAATLGKEGVREFNPMANLDFLSIPIGKYIQMNLDFGKFLKNPPRIYGVNYFLKDKNGNWLNDKLDKKVWLKWIELRCNGDIGGIETPIGIIPKYEDLVKLFSEYLMKEYKKDDYIKQFMIRVPENLSKIERIEKIYREKVKDTPDVVFFELKNERERLIKAKEKFGDYINPFDLEK
ncbi:MAG: phosphoenolpyruvate carboxykinase (GTP) [Caldisericia bacterium]|jgi:phosphoenolpyruvate carboxykinase (GTP)|nr:phosphoenolpyruvate carboxykinase (GTP) [Caldisericia bacterium]